jgi:hypothetical protein
MSSQELLENYGKAASVVKDFYLGKFLDSMEGEDLPDNFKEFAKEQGIDNDTVAKMIDAMPRALFDAFDAHEVYIGVMPNELVGGMNFKYVVESKSGEGATRVEAEKKAIELAFQILNDKL